MTTFTPDVGLIGLIIFFGASIPLDSPLGRILPVVATVGRFGSGFERTTVGLRVLGARALVGRALPFARDEVGRALEGRTFTEPVPDFSIMPGSTLVFLELDAVDFI